MEKLVTLLLVATLAVIGSCAELKKAEEVQLKKPKEIQEAYPPRVTNNDVDEKPKMLPIRIHTESGDKRKSTEDILRHMGMSKVRSPANNHRKRLASQSRKSHNEKQSGDSKVYVIKLPPNRYYYEQDAPKPSFKGQNLNRIPVSFKSNGKPGKIYHWNLPLVKKMIARKTGNSKLLKDHDANQVIKSGPVWPKEEQPLHYRRVSYYKPKKPSKQAFHKYFPGNGRPHSLYVIERSRRPHSKRTH